MVDEKIMTAIVINEDGKRRLVRGFTWNDITKQLSCADISITLISDCDFKIDVDAPIKVNEYKGFKVGDTIHIKRWFISEDDPDFGDQFNALYNQVMVDVKVPIDKILVWPDGHDAMYCGAYSTSTSDVANKGIVGS